MNLFRARRVLRAVQRHGHRRLRVHRPENNSAIREIVQEGLLHASLNDGSEESATVLGTVTEAGRRFLETFPAKYRLCEER